MLTQLRNIAGFGLGLSGMYLLIGGSILQGLPGRMLTFGGRTLLLSSGAIGYPYFQRENNG